MPDKKVEKQEVVDAYNKLRSRGHKKRGINVAVGKMFDPPITGQRVGQILKEMGVNGSKETKGKPKGNERKEEESKEKDPRQAGWDAAKDWERESGKASSRWGEAMGQMGDIEDLAGNQASRGGETEPAANIITPLSKAETFVLAGHGLTNPPCPLCGSTDVIKNSKQQKWQRWVCKGCDVLFKINPYTREVRVPSMDISIKF